MPIYEYQCKKCRREFEELVFGSEENVACPGCRSKGVKRLMSAAAFKCNGSFVSTASSGGCSGCSSHSCAGCK